MSLALGIPQARTAPHRSILYVPQQRDPILPLTRAPPSSHHDTNLESLETGDWRLETRLEREWRLETGDWSAVRQSRPPKAVLGRGLRVACGRWAVARLTLVLAESGIKWTRF
jgi:hypothetical protein